MAEEMEIIEGAEATEEELQAANEEFEPEVIELTEEELNEVAGGRQLKSSGPSRSVYCPWHHAYEQCTPCGRFTGELGSGAYKVTLRSMPVWWCPRGLGNGRGVAFYGPSTKNRYWASNGVPIR